MRSAKKCLAVVLTAVMILSCFALGGFSVSAAKMTENGVTYNCDTKSKTATVLSYECQTSADEVVIPETIGECTVTSIGTSAFAGDYVVSVTLPATVKTIAAFAFDGCVKLESIIVGDNIQSIGKVAFRNCSKLASFNFGNSLKTIDGAAFKGSGITAAVIPDTCQTIADNVFSECAFLESVTLPAGLTTVNSNLFNRCTALKSIVIPESVTEIKDDAFNRCSSLESVKMGDLVESIHQRAFYSCVSLREINLSRSLKSISTNLFWDCDSLEEIILPSSIKYIEFQGFRGCDKLKTIHLPDGVETIAERAFMNCQALDTVVIPGSVKSLNSKSFIMCDNIKTIYGVKDSEGHNFAKTKKYDFVGYELDAQGNALITCFECPDVADVNILGTIAGAKVTGIAKDAFRGNKDIKSVTLSSDILYIGETAFEGCLNLESFYFDTNNTHIGKYAFANCNGIKTVCLPMDVATIDEGAFGYVSSGDEYVPCDDFALYSGNNSAVQDYARDNKVGFRFGLLKELATGKVVMGVNYTEGSYKDGDAYRLVNILGDVNGDLSVNIKDATYIQKYCASLAEIDEADMYLSDTTLDGNVNVRDATQIQKYIASIIDSFYK